MHYETFTKDGQTLDQLHTENTALTVCRLGAELVSLRSKRTDDSWHGFLHRDNDVRPVPSGWDNHATIMGYYIHRILNKQSNYRGHIIHGDTHSFIRHILFDAPRVENDTLIYHLRSKQYTASDYPYCVNLTLSYRLLATGGVEVVFDFENEESTESHVSFGIHPGFVLSSLEKGRILLPPGKYTRHFAPGNFLSGETETIDFPGGEMPYPKSELPGSFLLDVTALDSPSVLVEDPVAGTQIITQLEDAPFLTLWSNADNFICVEPCWGIADHQIQRPFEQKLAMQTIAPHGHLRKTCSIHTKIG